MQVSDTVLIESRSARDAQLAEINPDRAMQILNKAKAIIFALGKQGVAMATTAQVAEFYEVTEDAVRQSYSTHKSELEADGVKVLVHKALRDARELFSLPSKASHATIWTPRGTVRLGMLLRDSDVAKRVRTNLLDIAESFVDRHIEAQTD
jgi:hypothetical protein